MSRSQRVVGTTEQALAHAEAELGRALPASFRAWLLAHNSTSLDAVEIFPVLDDRDPRKTWDSIVRQYGIWQSYCAEVFTEDERIAFQPLLPFAAFGTGDYYCFDYSHTGPSGEAVVVLWSHETGKTQPRGASFAEFAARSEAGDFDDD